MSLSFFPITFLPNLNISGCAVTRTGNATLTVGAGQLRDSNDNIDITIASTLTLNAAVNGVNGLDTGSLANSTMYYLYIIADPSLKNAPALLLSASATAPLMPSVNGTAYSAFRLIDFILTDGSAHFLQFYNTGSYSGRYKQYDAPISVLSAGNATSYTAVDLSVAVPPIQFGQVKLQSSYTPHAAAETAKLQPTGATGDFYTINGIVASVVQTDLFSILPLIASSKPEISYKLSVATSPAALSLSVCGYEFFI